MPLSVPYRCEQCMNTDACGYHGVLRFERDPIPVCDHHKGRGKPCHEGPVQMVPVKT